MAKNQDEQDVLEEMGASPPVAEAPATTAPLSDADKLDAVRVAILHAEADDELVEINGVEVAVRTPAIEDLLQYRNAQDDDTIMARAIVANTYMPGTDTHVFTEADVPELMKAKLTKGMKALNRAITQVLGGDEEITKAVDNDTKSNKA